MACHCRAAPATLQSLLHGFGRSCVQGTSQESLTAEVPTWV